MGWHDGRPLYPLPYSVQFLGDLFEMIFRLTGKQRLERVEEALRLITGSFEDGKNGLSSPSSDDILSMISVILHLVFSEDYEIRGK